MKRRGPGLLSKFAQAPVWMQVPGTPLTITGYPESKERLTGMIDWAPRGVISRVGRGLQEGKSVDDIAAAEESRGLPRGLLAGAATGGIAGALGGRVVAGKAATEPFKELLSKGLSKKTLRGLGRVPLAAKLGPLLGAGAGLLAGAGMWGLGRKERGQQARDVSRGLLSERLLQRTALRQAVGEDLPYATPLLRGIPMTSASVRPSYVVTPGNIGV